jgi:hypothetical protein
MDELIQRGLTSRGDTRTVIADPSARYFGAVLKERSLVPTGEAGLGETRFEEWLQKTSDSAESRPASQAASSK